MKWNWIWVVGLLWVLGLWGWRIVNWVWFRPKRVEKLLRQQGLAGNSYRFLFGDTKEITAAVRRARTSQPMSFSHHIDPRTTPYSYPTIHKYGKDSFTWFGTTPRVYITEPEQVKIVFSQINEFHKTSSFPFRRRKGSGLASLEGPKWAKHRKIINPAFHVEKLKDMFPAFSKSCREMVNKWENMISEEGRSEIDVWPDLQNMAADVISRTAFGSSYEEGKKIFLLLKEAASLSTTYLTNRIYFIPGFRYIPTKLNKRMRETDRKIRDMVLSIINKRQNAMEKGEASNNEDLIGILLESNASQIEEDQNKKEVGMSIEEVINECRLFYFAGQETTAALLTWTMILLGRYSEWQDRARAEVLEVFGDNKNLDFDPLSHLKIVSMVLNEVLRLYPPVGMLAREIQNETKLGNLTLPSGVSIGIPILSMHQNPKIWGEDAIEFNPGRFSEGISKATKNQVCYIPFGWGPRICIGQNFAMIEAKIALSMILQQFSFTLSPTYTHAPITNITIQPQHGAHLILRKL
ncbi:cytochrome P450 CYP72A219-like protein [Cucumis melo var. makuwa]|uniref:Cytochrome P450 CYP72A219-like protein n=2 Tax=Cucumis melo TaxID=3656 RepID=A0A5A7UCX1_CUCMM|nr:cytochrome P450 CYP72A219-like protein [Cucumis melo var. makuwa]